MPFELPGAHGLKMDMAFATDESFMGIPKLREDMMWELPEGANLSTWPGKDLIDRGIYSDDPENNYYYWQVGSSPKGIPFKRCVLIYYAEDDKFEKIWDLPDMWAGRMLNTKLSGSGVPDFSVWWDQPLAYHCYQYYRAAWVARYLQEAGVKIIPDLKVGPFTDIYPELQVAGIPKNPPFLSFQSQTSLRDQPAHIIESRFKSIRDAIERVEPERLIVYASKYGRQMHEPILPEGLPVLWLETVMDVRRDHIQTQEGEWR